MATSKEIYGRIKSVENTKKITKAMEMVAASKMRKAQNLMHSARPYSDKILRIASRLSQAKPDYTHPFMVEKKNKSKNIGFIFVTTDKGLCGGMNTNSFRLLTKELKKIRAKDEKPKLVAIGSKGLSFLHRIGSSTDIVAHTIQMGDAPNLDQLTAPTELLLNAYRENQLDAINLVYTKFINTMKQEPVIQQLLPLPHNFPEVDEAHKCAWNYIYEPDEKSIIDGLLVRYVEALIYQSVAENMASEQSARMVAMKSASDNAGNVIGELKLIYNKTRQAAITKELSEIVAGATAVS
jgi:F-type H+-transporting ATPase subunit gamma